MRIARDIILASIMLASAAMADEGPEIVEDQRITPDWWSPPPATNTNAVAVCCTNHTSWCMCWRGGAGCGAGGGQCVCRPSGAMRDIIGLTNNARFASLSIVPFSRGPRGTLVLDEAGAASASRGIFYEDDLGVLHFVSRDAKPGTYRVGLGRLRLQRALKTGR